MSLSSPPRPAPPPPPPPPARTLPAAQASVTFSEPDSTAGERIGIYGPGGIGKTTLAAAAPGPVVFFDLDGSLGKLKRAGMASTARVVTVSDWAGIRAALSARTGWESIRTIVIDSATRAEEMATEWVVVNVPHEKGNSICRIEDYGYGKGYRHLYDQWVLLLQDLQTHVDAGRNVVIVCHDIPAKAPNPLGEDWLRYEPHLYESKQKDGVSLRKRTITWLDHLIFIGYDVFATDGKARGTGSRTIYLQEMPTHIAKVRGLSPKPISYAQGDCSLWLRMFPSTKTPTQTPKEVK